MEEIGILLGRANRLWWAVQQTTCPERIRRLERLSFLVWRRARNAGAQAVGPQSPVENPVERGHGGTGHLDADVVIM